ncbi:MAG TPA: hydrolase [Actinoplanes sp.]|jgi:dienelactone hydrolase
MIQAWYPAQPARHRPTAPYMSPSSARALEAAFDARRGSLSAVVTHARLEASALIRPEGWPLILFSHGRNGNRTNLTAVAEDLASHGFVVVGVDHTYDSFAVQFPDGRTATANRPAVYDDAVLAEEVAVRAADLRFVLDQVLADRAVRRISGRVSHHRIGVFGHSLGGATAAELLRTDRRVRAGSNLDGAFATTSSTLATPRPFLLYTRPDHHGTWTRWAAEQRAWGRHLVVAGTGHFSFTDFDTLAEAIGVVRHPAFFGTITPGRTTELDRAYLRAFFQHHLRHRPTRLFDQPVDPEVTVNATAPDVHPARRG